MKLTTEPTDAAARALSAVKAPSPPVIPATPAAAAPPASAGPAPVQAKPAAVVPKSPEAPAPTVDGSKSSFDASAPKTIAAPPAATVDPSRGTVTASQLSSASSAPVAPPRFDATAGGTKPVDPKDLSAILRGGGANQPPLSRDQVAQTVLAAVPAAERAKAEGLIKAGVTDASLASAFNQVLDARATPGEKSLKLDLVGFEFKTVEVPSGEGTFSQTTREPAAPTTFSNTVTVDGLGRVNGQPLAADVAAEADAKPYPEGKPTPPPTKYEPTGKADDLSALLKGNGKDSAQPPLNRQAVVDTVLEALPESERTKASALIADGVTDQSLAKAFNDVLDARKTPGKNEPELSLVGFTRRTVTVSQGENESSYVEVKPDRPTTFRASMEVSEDGKVNGKALTADLVTEVAGANRGVANDFKDASLRQAGLSDEWMRHASAGDKATALAKIVDASRSPGQTKLDLGYEYQSSVSVGEDTRTVTSRAAGAIQLDVGEGGKVNGARLPSTLAATAGASIDAMPGATRRATLQALGFEAGAVAGASQEQQRNALVRASVATATPGSKQFEVQMGGDKYAVGMKVGEQGEILGAGTARIPPPPKKQVWKQVVSVVATVVSVVYPPLAPVCQLVNAAIAASSGAKGLALVGAVAGAAAGVAGAAAGLTGSAMASAAASTLTTVSNVATAANSAVTAYKQGDYLGALSGALMAGAGVAGGGLGDTLRTASTIAGAASGVVNAAKTGDVLGGVAAGAVLANGVGQATGVGTSAVLNTVGKLASTVRAVENHDWAGAAAGLRDLGRIVANTPQTTSTNPTVDEKKASELDEDFEQGIIGGKRKPAKIVTLANEENTQGPLALAFHGTNGTPGDMQSFHDAAKADGKTSATVAYDDRYRRLGDTVNDLTDQLGKWIDENPGRPLEITTHSMSSRVMPIVLDNLAKQGKLDMPVTFSMVAPPLGGFTSANFARLAPEFIGQYIPGVEIGKDMGTSSEFQQQLESIKLPGNVKVTIYTGGKDKIVDPTLDGFTKIVENLKATVVNLENADHMTAIDQALMAMRKQPE